MAFEALKTHKYFDEVHSRLCAGVAPEKVAEWLQAEGQFLELKLTSLTRNLYRYRDTIPKAELPAEGTNKFLARKLEQARQGLNEVEELEKLFALQMHRVALGMEKEEQIGYLDKRIRGEMELAASILQKSAELKFKHGVYKATPITVDVNATMKTTASNLIETLPEDQKNKLGSIAQMMLHGLAQAALPPGAPGAEPVPEAEWEVVAASPAPAGHV